MLRTCLVVLLLLLAAAPLRADGERPGTFSYYVLSLSWSPTWCALTGDSQGADQCHPRHDFGWILHGLWPQYERGWPAWCPTSRPPPSRRQTRQIADIMGSSGLAWHQWRKHGTCTGLDAETYFALARQAFAKIRKPDVLRRLDRAVRLPAKVIEAAFLRANPGLAPDMITVTCKAGRISEVRICLTRDLRFRRCGPDVARDCALDDALFDPVR